MHQLLLVLELILHFISRNKTPTPSLESSHGGTYLQSLLNSTCPFLRGELESADKNIPSLVAVLRSVGVGECWHKHDTFLDYLSNISRQADYGADPVAPPALHDYLSTIGDAVDQIRDSLKQRTQLGSTSRGSSSFRFQMSLPDLRFLDPKWAPAFSFGFWLSQQSNFKRFMGGDFVPVYVVVGTMAVSMRLGLHTANAKKERSSSSAARKTPLITLPEATIQLGRRLWGLDRIRKLADNYYYHFNNSLP
ncbi:hypothetical protein ACFX2F_006470 [Malus domestica]